MLIKLYPNFGGFITSTPPSLVAVPDFKLCALGKKFGSRLLAVHSEVSPSQPILPKTRSPFVVDLAGSSSLGDYYFQSINLVAPNSGLLVIITTLYMTII